ncbi:MAG TPA: DNA polymerase III subunit delta' C-terminal domain-containing protein, partial [Nitrospirales bacterium]
ESRFIYRPLIGRLKIVVLDNADLLRREAANALLKTIEEPPPDSLIILISSRLEALLPTIRSRCQEIRFAPLALDVVEAAVRQRRGLTEKDARFLSIISGGRLGLALEADPEALRAEQAEFLRLVSPETVESISGLLSACEAVGKSDRAEASLGWLAAWFRDLVIVKVGGDRTRLLNADCLKELEALAARLKVDTIADLAAYVESMHRGLERNLNKQLMLEGLLLRLRAALQAKAA